MMSQESLIDFWALQCQNLSILGVEDAKFANGGPYNDQKIVKVKIENLFIRYAMTANNLRDLADEIKNPILTNIIRKTYELTVSRALQLHFELTRLLSDNFINLDNVLIHQTITPADIQLKPPYYLKKKRWQRKKNIDDWFEGNSVKNISEGESKNVSIISKKEPTEVEVFDTKLLPVSQLEKYLDAKEKNNIVQKMLKENYEDSIYKTTIEFKDKYQRKIEENVEDEIIEWIEFFFHKTGHLPSFPPKDLVFATGEIFGAPKKISKEVKLRLSASDNMPSNTFSKEFAGLPKLSGSQLIVSSHWINPEDWILCKNDKQAKTTGKKMKKIKSDGKTSGFKLETTDYFSIMNLLKLKQFGSLNFNIETDIKLNAMIEIGVEIRAAVDDMMREELKAKKSRKKLKKKKGKRKGKKKKSLPTTELCKEQLFECGVLKQGNNCNLYDKDGEYTSEIRGKFDGELLDFLLNRCIFPHLSCAIHHFAPLTRSVCLLGPQNSENEYLLDMLVTETGSTLFDLSPAVTADIFPGKKGIKTLISLVGRLARELQPSIIFVADVDKIFSKKVSKKDKNLNPKRLEPLLLKLIKSINKSDRILVIATAAEPWLAKTKKIIKTFNNFLYIPSSNYGTHILAWQNLLEKNVDLTTVAALAKTSSKQKCAYHNIKEAVMKTDLEENIIDNLAINHPEVQSKFLKFLEKTPFGKSKLKIKETDNKNTTVKKRKNKY